jgi:hypothetical protein
MSPTDLDHAVWQWQRGFAGSSTFWHSIAGCPSPLGPRVPMWAHLLSVGSAKATPGTAAKPTVPANTAAITNDFISAPSDCGEFERASLVVGSLIALVPLRTRKRSSNLEK